MVALLAIFALSIVSPVMADQIACLTPGQCATNQTLSTGTWGGSATATLELYGSSQSAGATYYYYVCPTGQTSCNGQSGTDATTGWSWTFAPASGTTANSGSCIGSPCEGNGVGSPGSLTLTVTSPSTPNAYTHESLTVYACTTTGTTTQCSGQYTETASLTIVSNVPQFAYGIGIAMAIGVLGLVLVRKASVPKIVPSAAV